VVEESVGYFSTKGICSFFSSSTVLLLNELPVPNFYPVPYPNNPGPDPAKGPFVCSWGLLDPPLNKPEGAAESIDFSAYPLAGIVFILNMLFPDAPAKIPPAFFSPGVEPKRDVGAFSPSCLPNRLGPEEPGPKIL